MKTFILVILLIFVVSTQAFSELTEKDLENIKAIVTEIVHKEVALIHKDITESELRLNEKIRESENRLQTQFSQALDNRTNGIMIIFAVISMGFFLLFTAILLAGALRNRQLNKQAIILMVLSLAGVLICRPSLDARTDRFEDIICRSLTVVDGDDKKLIYLGPNKKHEELYHTNTEHGIQIFDSEEEETISLIHQLDKPFQSAANSLKLYGSDKESQIWMHITSFQPLISLLGLTQKG